MVTFGSRAMPARWASWPAMTSGEPTQRRRAAAVLDAGYLAGVVTDPLPELGKRPPGRAPRPAHLPSEVPGWIARAIAHRLTPWPGALKRDGESLEVDAEGITAPAVALR